MQDRVFGNAKKRAGRVLSLDERKKIIKILKKEIEAFETGCLNKESSEIIL